MPLATSTDHGHNLQTVQLLIKKNQVSISARGGGLRLTGNCSDFQGRAREGALEAHGFSLALTVCCCGLGNLLYVFPAPTDPPERNPGAPASHR